jgi:hypothetical protein
MTGHGAREFQSPHPLWSTDMEDARGFALDQG